MYCSNCGKEVHPQAVACPSCGVPPRLEKKFCNNCATPIQPNQLVCTKCGVSVGGGSGAGEKSKIAAGLLAIFLGSLGIHKFYLGYTKEGLIMLLISVLTCGIGAGIMSIIGLIEGIIYLTKSDAEFVQTYVQG
ncbi:MAG: TM2 domain-containing protein, partial [Kiritimatiellae bacterium]|nr:TM2 domain-containing protein [Kiritimatiellia bacterium]